jgi:AraC-like DNA-binding protein
VGFGDDRPRRFEGRPDQIGFVPHGVPLKGVTTTARSQYMALLLNPAVRVALAEEAPSLQTLPPCNHVSAGILRPIVNALEAEIRSPYFGPLYAGAAVRTLLLGLGGIHAGRSLQHSRVGLADWRLRRVEEYIEAHLGEDITLEALSAVAGLSQSHFAHAFKRATGYPPHQWLLHRRIERAKELLAGHGVRLADVALLLGFCNQAHFSTAFRRVTGITPAAWREHAAPPSTTWMLNKRT